MLGEHLIFPEAEMVTHGSWEDAIATAKGNYEKWNAAYEEKGGKEDLRQMQSYQLRMNALEDAFAHDRAIRDALTLVNGNMDRIAPEGAARKPSAGVMLTYGEVGQIQATGMKVAKTNIALSDASLEDLAKRGQLVTSDAPMRLRGVGGGDYNAAIVYAKGAPEQVYQAALARADEYIKNGANASREDLAYWTLRDKGFDAIEHADGSTTALYPREQIKHVSDFVNKSSREYIEAPKAPLPTEGV